MYLNPLMTDRELIDAAQYAENPHLRLLADRLDDKIVIIQKARNMLRKKCFHDLPDGLDTVISDAIDILES